MTNNENYISILEKYGLTGQSGPRGFVGPRGNTGPDGFVGPSGNTGPRGIDGPRGFIGPRGNSGPRGIVGPRGEKGNTGPRGIDGPISSQGNGPKGEKGDSGEKGEKGEKGNEGMGFKIFMSGSEINENVRTAFVGHDGEFFLKIGGKLYCYIVGTQEQGDDLVDFKYSGDVTNESVLIGPKGDTGPSGFTIVNQQANQIVNTNASNEVVTSTFQSLLYNFYINTTNENNFYISEANRMYSGSTFQGLTLSGALSNSVGIFRITNPLTKYTYHTLSAPSGTSGSVGYNAPVFNAVHFGYYIGIYVNSASSGTFAMNIGIESTTYILRPPNSTVTKYYWFVIYNNGSSWTVAKNLTLA